MDMAFKKQDKNKAVKKEYNTPTPEILPPIPGTEKFGNTYCPETNKFLISFFVFSLSFLYYTIVKYKLQMK